MITYCFDITNLLLAITLNGSQMFNVKVQTTSSIDYIKYNKK